MKDGTRRAIAYIVGRLLIDGDATAIFDDGGHGYANFSGDVDANRVDVYDYDRGCYIEGDRGSNGLSLFDYGTLECIELQVQVGSFEGYDYHSGKHFSGEVNGANIIIFDDEFGKDFWYSV